MAQGAHQVTAALERRETAWRRHPIDRSRSQNGWRYGTTPVGNTVQVNRATMTTASLVANHR